MGNYRIMKPCPFCGGYGKLSQKSKTIIKGELTYVTYCYCGRCGCRGTRFIITENNIVEARDNAVSAWNTRKEPII